jgi:16S rRNA (adenine1518-N6/adenine1519-N6)-dimethyltransferase
MIFAKKSYGQHFLTSESIASHIADALQPLPPVNHILEVGPGRGMLSKYLVAKYPGMTMVEADPDMIEVLRKDRLYDQCSLLQDDFLKLNLRTLFGGSPLLIIGNFPYNISSQIVFKMIDHRDLIPGMVGMFQKEVGERIAHDPGSKIYGVISVLTQAYYKVEYLFTVSEDNFKPAPKVKSAVLRFTRKPELHLGCDEVLFKTIVKACFLQRRKMIRNTLKVWLTTDTLLDSFFDLRPEQLSVQDFVRITQLVMDAKK